MLVTLITSKTRLKLLIKFFAYATNKGYLRGLAEEFHESTNAIRKELNQLTDAGYLTRAQQDNKVIYQANSKHPLFNSLQRLIRDYLGMDELIDNIFEKSGDIEQISLIGDYAKGIDSGILEVCILGDDLDRGYLSLLAGKSSEILQKSVKLYFEEQPASEHQIILFKNK
ncbi:helix-turn-helix domain-containing protein [Sphingobacterium lumbrici]|uniref:ArsR family transcriptional regulator n=1 Tax=Sphingobacterium lumbrici TaxID=2559600 RepID=UPI00112EF348|nr:ArsR family transcriptional regulator [Sphingobacterium lumbrici]